MILCLCRTLEFILQRIFYGLQLFSLVKQLDTYIFCVLTIISMFVTVNFKAKLEVSVFVVYGNNLFISMIYAKNINKQHCISVQCRLIWCKVS